MYATAHLQRLLSLGWLLVLPVQSAVAHGVSESDKQAMIGGGVLEYMWLGASHMLTGYDHLLFLFGVIFFLTGFKDIVRFITAFTLGHCITLLGTTLVGVSANAYLIDAVIAVSVMYKGFENVDGFKRYFKRDAPNLLWMVFLFGLLHGFGLSTRLQELPLGEEGLIVRILSFNVGVELGQIAALCVMLLFFNLWRKFDAFKKFSVATNVGLILAGLGLFVFQMVGFFTDPGHAEHLVPPAAEEHHEIHETHGHAHDAPAAHGHADDAPKTKGHSHGDSEGHGHGHDAHGHPHD